jgi:phage terminase Nu1 subunit (DNA packaging protein)
MSTEQINATAGNFVNLFKRKVRRLKTWQQRTLIIFQNLRLGIIGHKFSPYF